MGRCAWTEEDHRSNERMVKHMEPDQPVLVDELHPARFMRWEDEWVGRKIGFFFRCFQTEEELGPRKIDRVVARDGAGTHHLFYFDTTLQKEGNAREVEEAVKSIQAREPLEKRLRKRYQRDPWFANEVNTKVKEAKKSKEEPK